MSIFDSILKLFEQRFPGDLQNIPATTMTNLNRSKQKIIALWKECASEVYIQRADEQKEQAKTRSPD